MHKKKIIQICCAAVLAIAPFSALHAKPTGSLQTKDGVFTFSPALCAIYKEDDAYDIEVHGPGSAPNGEKVYVGFSSMGEFLEVHFGADHSTDVSDTRIQSDGTLQTHVDGLKVRVESIRLVDQGRQAVDEDAALEIDCSRT